MAEFSGASLWMRLTMLLLIGAFSMHLFSLVGAGYAGTSCGFNGCDKDTARAVVALEIIGFLSVLTAFFLSLCLVLLDELKGNKIALIFLCIFSLIAGIAIIVGIAVYEDKTNVKGISPDGSEFASTIGVMGAICALLAGVFCILELVGVSGANKRTGASA